MKNIFYSTTVYVVLKRKSFYLFFKPFHINVGCRPLIWIWWLFSVYLSVSEQQIWPPSHFVWTTDSNLWLPTKPQTSVASIKEVGNTTRQKFMLWWNFKDRIQLKETKDLWLTWQIAKSVNLFCLYIFCFWVCVSSEWQHVSFCLFPEKLMLECVGERAADGKRARVCVCAGFCLTWIITRCVHTNWK